MILSKPLSTRIGISVDDLTKKKTFETKLDSPVENMSVIALSISFVLFALLSVYYAVNSSKKIGVSKLNGHANFDIWKSMVGSIVSIMLFSALILDLILLFSIKGMTRDFLFSMGSIQVILICSFLILSLLIYVIIRRNTIGNLIKNKKPIHIVVGMTYAVKSVLFMFLIGFIIIISNIFVEVNKEFTKLAQWREVGDLAVLANTEIGEDKESIAQGKTKLDDDFGKYYTEINKEGIALLAFSSKYIPHRQFKTEVDEKTGALGYVSYFDPSVVPENYSNDTFDINPNYLNTYPIYDSQGKQIVITDRDAKTILIPDTLEDRKENLISLYKSDYIDRILSDKRRHGEQVTEIPKVNVNAIIYKADKKGYFTFNSAYESTNYMVYSPIFVVFTETSMTRLDKSQMSLSGLNSPIKIKLNGKDSSSFNESMVGSLQKYELDDNNLKFMTIKEVFGTQIESLNNAMKQFTIAVFLSFLVMVLMTLQLSQMLLEIRKKKYCVQKLYGYKFLDRYKHLVILNACLGIVVAVLAIMIVHSQFETELSFISYIVCIPFIFIDIFLTMAMLRYYENKNVSKMMKGE